jgi:glucoamylase
MVFLWPSVSRAAIEVVSPATLDALFDGRRTPHTAAVQGGGLEGWIGTERSVALSKMLANISPPGTAPGSVAASPSKENPNYWYNWKRDAALTMEEVLSLYRSTSDPAQKQAYLKMLMDYAAFTRKQQTIPSQTGIGEPKSNMDGTAFTGPWGRPQDDGPAEEASTLIGLASALIDAGHRDAALQLYGDFTSGIKADLEYVSHHWQETSFDVWEEVKAHHFDTAMAQRTAMFEGAWLAKTLGDKAASDWYLVQGKALDAELAKHWDPAKGYIVSSEDRDAGLDYKASGLDSAVILAAIHRQPIDDAVFPGAEKKVFSVTDKRVLATAEALKDAFKADYPINQRPDAPAVAIGRYPEDQYFGGNPWVLNTNAFAQLYYMAASEFVRQGSILVESEDLAFLQSLLQDAADKTALTPGKRIPAGDPLFGRLISGLKAGGDGYLRVVEQHANPDGSLSEQMDKNSGYMASARDLTWNYASFLSAVQARDALNQSLR